MLLFATKWMYSVYDLMLSQRKINTAWYHFYLESKTKSEFIENIAWKSGYQRLGLGGWWN